MYLYIIFYFLLFISVGGHRLNSKTIPKLLIRTYHDSFSELNSIIHVLFNKTLTNNIEYTILYFSDNDIDVFIKKYFPYFWKNFKSVIPGAYRSDIFRLLVVYYYGGIYADLGMQFVLPMNRIIAASDEFVIPIDMDEEALFNGFFASYPGHPILHRMIIHVMNNIDKHRYGCSSLDITGPMAIARAYNYYSKRNRKYRFKQGKEVIVEYNNKIHFFKHHFGNIYDHVKVMENKFSEYKSIISKNNTIPHYSEYYQNRTVFRDVSSDIDKPFDPQEGDLIRIKSKANKMSLLLFFNNTFHHFPNQDTFHGVGYEYCLSIAPTIHKLDARYIPIGDALSANMTSTQIDDFIKKLENYSYYSNVLEYSPSVLVDRVVSSLNYFGNKVVLYEEFDAYLSTIAPYRVIASRSVSPEQLMEWLH